jgi:hypothetical protein
MSILKRRIPESPTMFKLSRNSFRKSSDKSSFHNVKTILEDPPPPNGESLHSEMNHTICIVTRLILLTGLQEQIPLDVAQETRINLQGFMWVGDLYLQYGLQGFMWVEICTLSMVPQPGHSYVKGQWHDIRTGLKWYRWIDRGQEMASSYSFFKPIIILHISVLSA